MKTFEQLKEHTTPEFIKKLCELAEEFESIDSLDGVIGLNISMIKDNDWISFDRFLNNYRFPLLLHRAVEGFNKLNFKYGEEKSVHLEINYPDEQIEFIKNERTQKIFLFEDYQPSHLTPCEMAILDCLIEVLK